MKSKKISYILILSIIFSLMTSIETKADDNPKNIIYFCSQNSKFGDFQRSKTKKSNNVNIKKYSNITKNVEGDNIIWIDYARLKALNGDEINIIVDLLNCGHPLVVIKDNIDEKQVVEALNLKVQVPKVINKGNSFTQAIKIENFKGTYLFTGMNIIPDYKINGIIRDNSLVEGSFCTSVRDNYLNGSLQVFGLQPTGTSTFSLVNTIGRTYTYRDINAIVIANSYKYNNNPFGGKNIYINMGKFQITQKKGKTSYVYTYVNVPKGSIVTDYGPKISKAASDFTINLTKPKAANFPAKVTVKTNYKLDAGGPGYDNIQILSNPYNNMGNSSLQAGETLQVTQPLEYVNTTKACNGSYVFTTMGGQYIYSDGFYMNENNR